MKKIIAITAMAAAAAATLAFADEPVADVKVAEFTGSAAVTWGVDLDNEGKSGFKNDADASFKVNIANGGDKSTEGDGIWAELKVKTDGLSIENGGVTNGKASVDTAKLHFGPVYLGIQSGDTVVGDFKVPNAIYSSQFGTDKVRDSGDHSQGVFLGYGSDVFDVAVDFRSNPDKVTTTTSTTTYTWYYLDDEGEPVIKTGTRTEYEDDTHSGKTLLNVEVKTEETSKEIPYSNNYGIAGEATLKFLPGLELKLGADYQFDTKEFGAGVSEKYTIALGDTFKLIEGVGYTFGYADDGNSSTDDYDMELAAGVVFAWGDEKDDNAGVPYLQNNNAKKVTPGVGVALSLPLDGDDFAMQIVPSFYSGDLIPNLKIGVLGEVNVVGDDVGFGVAGGVKYNLALNDSLTISPYAGARFADGATLPSLSGANEANTDRGGLTDIEGADADGQIMNVKLGADVSGLINNTTFSLDWTSRNLLSDHQDDGKVGTINFTCKISF